MPGKTLCSCVSTLRPVASVASLSPSEVSSLASASLAIFSSANATANVAGHPANMRKAQQLLRPLIISDTLQVKPSDQIAGNLVTELQGQLDNAVPGLTTDQGGEEHLNKAAVHRLYVYGFKQPTFVFKPNAARGVSEEERLLRGKAANTVVSLAGQSPAVTARQLGARDEATASRFWPDLARWLRVLAGTLR